MSTATTAPVANIAKDDQGRFISTDERGAQFVSDAHGNALKDEEGFVTFVNVSL